jgi:hypothetical protein
MMLLQLRAPLELQVNFTADDVAMLDLDRWGGNCDRNRGGFKCPAKNGCPAGNCREDGPGSWQEWVDAHNIRRCMHDVPSITWSNAMYDHVKRTFQNQRQMSHSNSYGVAPPAGPAGENLAWASYTLSPEQSTKMWYDEVNNCGSFPGCKTGSRGVTGHFTALIWDGVETIGCHSNQHKLVACQYKGKDQKGCTTPNMGGSYETNVFSAVKSKAQCERIVEQCKNGDGSPVLPDDGDGEIDDSGSRQTPSPTPSRGGGGGTCTKTDYSVTFTDMSGNKRDCGGMVQSVAGFCSSAYRMYCTKSCACKGGEASCCEGGGAPPAPPRRRRATPPPTTPRRRSQPSGKTTIMELKNRAGFCKGKKKWIIKSKATVESCQRACLSDNSCKYAALKKQGKPNKWKCASYKKCKSMKKSSKYMTFQKTKTSARLPEIWTE